MNVQILDPKVTPKVWGKEFEFVSEECRFRVLEVKRAHRTSIHLHDFRDEVLFCVAGKVLVEAESLERPLVLEKGSVPIRIPFGTKHRVTGLDEQSVLIDITFGDDCTDEHSHRHYPSEEVSPEDWERIWDQFPLNSVVRLF